MSRQMPDGIDLVEFLAEIWRVKWRFVGIVLALTVVFGLTPLLFEGMRKFSGGPEAVGVRRSVIRVTRISGNYRPYDLDYLSDVLARVKKYDKAGFDYVGDFPKGAKIRPLNYEYESVPGGYFINLKTPEASADLVSVFRDALIEASAEQFADVVRQVKLDVALADKMIAESPSLGGDLLAQRAFTLHRFLTLPGVADGTMRFIKIGELYSSAPQKASTMKIWTIGALSGIVVACFYVVARITLSRRNATQV